jgi:hypothetical protein
LENKGLRGRAFFAQVFHRVKLGAIIKERKKDKGFNNFEGEFLMSFPQGILWGLNNGKALRGLRGYFLKLWKSENVALTLVSEGLTGLTWRKNGRIL